MKLLRIFIRNLNSLRGEHTLDFRTPPLANHQLYAIVGKTGAGKSTILDAVTLALYGTTDRSVENFETEASTVMTYGTGECRAEVEFSTSTGTYRSAWAQGRAYGKPDGRLQKPKRNLDLVDAETGESVKSLADSITSHNKEVPEVVGLDYDRFIRSAMLTQGAFARFLESTGKEKAELLEKITGTLLYRDLGIAAFERNKRAAAALETAKRDQEAQQPLGEEARTALEKELRQARTEQQATKVELDRVVKQLTAYQALATVAADHAAASEKQARVEKKWTELAGARQRLADSERVNELRTDLEATDRLTKELSALDEAVATSQKKVTQASQVVAASVVKEKAARVGITEFLERLPAREAKCTAAAVLEQEVAEQRARADELRRLRQQQTRTRQQADDTLKQLGQEQTSITKALSGRTAEELNAETEGLATSLASLRKEEVVARVQLDHARISEQLTEARGQLSKTEQQVAELARSLPGLEVAAKAAADRFNDKEKIVELLETQQKLFKYKQKLQPGEQCPICGATEHPALTHETYVDSAEVAAAKADVVRAENDQLHADQAVTRVTTEIAVHSEVVNRQTKRVTELEGELAEFAADIRSNSSSVVEVKEQLAVLSAEQAKQEKALTALRELGRQLPRLAELQTLIRTEEEKQTSCGNTIKQLDQQLAEHEAKVAGLINQKRTLLGGGYSAAECRQQLVDKDKQLTGVLNEAEKQRVLVEGQLQQQQEALQTTSERRGTTHSALVTVSTALRTALNELAVTEAEARTSLLSTAEEKQLRAQRDEVATRKASLAELVHKLSADLEQRKAATAELPPAEDLRKQQPALESTYQTVSERAGAATQRLADDDERRVAYSAKAEEIAVLTKEYERWARLHELIGSADGSKFRRYAQALTLSRLIEIGNHHLQDISGRYLMSYDESKLEDLNILIVDGYHNDNVRSVATLSGGETFLISLALALGLSDLASGKSLMESLFIDEGFGTLDANSLDQAMQTLENLRDRGKVIGLISHVEQLKERIACKIELTPLGDGTSSLAVVVG